MAVRFSMWKTNIICAIWGLCWRILSLVCCFAYLWFQMFSGWAVAAVLVMCWFLIFCHVDQAKVLSFSPYANAITWYRMSFWRPNLQREGFEDALLDHHKKQHRSVWESLVHSGVHLGGQDMNRPGRIQRAKVQRQDTALEWCQQHWEQDDEENQEPQVTNENKSRKANIQRIIDKTDKTIMTDIIMIPISTSSPDAGPGLGRVPACVWTSPFSLLLGLGTKKVDENTRGLDTIFGTIWQDESESGWHVQFHSFSRIPNPTIKVSRNRCLNPH